MMRTVGRPGGRAASHGRSACPVPGAVRRRAARRVRGAPSQCVGRTSGRSTAPLGSRTPGWWPARGPSRGRAVHRSSTCDERHDYVVECAVANLVVVVSTCEKRVSNARPTGAESTGVQIRDSDPVHGDHSCEAADWSCAGASRSAMTRRWGTTSSTQRAALHGARHGSAPVRTYRIAQDGAALFPCTPQPKCESDHGLALAVRRSATSESLHSLRGS